MQSSPLYLLNSTENPFGFVEEGLQRADGSWFKTRLSNYEDCVLQLPFKPPAVLTDFIRAMGGNRLFSNLSMNILRDHRIQPSIHWVNVDVKYRSKSLDSYYAIACSEEVHVLNMEKAKYKWIIPREHLIEVSQWVIDEKKIPDYDFFLGEVRKLLVSHKFKTAWETAGLTGAEFIPCEVSN